MLSKSYAVSSIKERERFQNRPPDGGGASSLIARSNMLDLVFTLAGPVFFLLTAAYAAGCERL